MSFDLLIHHNYWVDYSKNFIQIWKSPFLPQPPQGGVLQAGDPSEVAQSSVRGLSQIWEHEPSEVYE